jgi:hypothetical protein
MTTDSTFRKCIIQNSLVPGGDLNPHDRLRSVRTAAPPPGAKSPALGLVMFSNPTLVQMVCALLGERKSLRNPLFRRRKVFMVPLCSLSPCL